MINDIEEWRTVAGFEGIYEVSSHGRVRRLARLGASGYGLSERILKQSIGNGYPFVGLRDGNGTFVVKRVHAMVAHAFLGPRPKGKVTNHIDHNRANNHVSNLEYVTHKENIHHAARNGRMGLLSCDEVKAIRSLVARDPGFNLDLLAEKLEVEIHVIRRVIEARSYTLIENKDGTMPTPLHSTYGKAVGVEDITDLQALGFSIPEIGRYYELEYSAPYQALRRAGIWQENSKSSTRGTGRRKGQPKPVQ